MYLWKFQWKLQIVVATSLARKGDLLTNSWSFQKLNIGITRMIMKRMKMIKNARIKMKNEKNMKKERNISKNNKFQKKNQQKKYPKKQNTTKNAENGKTKGT